MEPYVYVEKWSAEDNRFVAEYFPTSIEQAFDQARYLIEEYDTEIIVVRILSTEERILAVNLLEPFHLVAVIGDFYC